MLESTYITAAGALAGLAVILAIFWMARGRKTGDPVALKEPSGVSFVAGLRKTRSALSAALSNVFAGDVSHPVSYTHLRAHET